MGKKRRRKAQAANSGLTTVAAGIMTAPQSLQLLLTLAITVLAYAVTLDVPFYLDDFTSIRENPALRDLGNLEAVYGFSPARFISYLSFALNFAWHGYELAGYHLVNIAVHLGTVAVVFFLSRELLRRVEAGEPGRGLFQYLPFLTALLFAVHPLQIQAVTYIVQRSASLAALFYLLSIYAYVTGRIAAGNGRRSLFFALALFAGGLSLFTKQNSVTLPLALVLVELVFFEHRRETLKRLLGAGVGIALATVILLYIAAGREFFESLSEAARETELVTRWQYLAIQMGVLWNYLFKFFVPYSLHLEYDIPVATFRDQPVQLYALLHMLVIGWAIWAIRRFPVVAFGILFYYTAHLVESSVIPIRDFAFEHRTYLPNFGLCLVTAWVLLTALPKVMPARHALMVCGLVVLVAMGLTIDRNLTWADPIAFYRHETEVNPELLRPWSILGETYLRENRNEEAVEAYRQGEEYYGRGLDRQNNTQVAFYQNYILALDRIRAWDEAMEVLSRINFDVLDPPNLSRFLFLRGNILANQERLDEAEPDLRRAIELDPANFDARLSYGKILYVTGNLPAARRIFEELLEMDPQHYSAIEARALIDNIDRLLEQ